MTPIRPFVREVVLWVLGPTRAPWSGREEQTNTREGVAVFGSAAALAAIYWGIVGRQQLYFEPIDGNLVLLLDTLVIPIVLSLLLLLLGRAADLNAVFQTLSWLYRAWTLQLLLVWFWALVLKQLDILSPVESPVVTDFSVVLAVTAIIVSALTAMSMRRGNENWRNILSAWAVYCFATLISWMLSIPAVGAAAWWAPDVVL